MWGMSSIRKLVQILWVTMVALFASAIAANPPGRIVFLGKTANDQRSVWLSLTTAGRFEVEARNQTVDEWTQDQLGLHTTFSPIVSNGSGDPHSLFQIINGELVFIDKDNQQGGITFPPLPGGNPPGEVTPPIYLPPVEAMPPIYLPPGEIAHPIVPPSGEVLPPSGEVSPPIASSPDGISPSTSDSPTSSSSSPKSDGFTRKAPITPGREFAKEPFLNVWVDARYFKIKDHRFDLDRKGSATNLAMGADRRVNKDLVVGIMLARNTGASTSFDDTWQTNARGFTFGPYLGYRFLPNWAIDGTIGYGKLKNHNNIAILNSKYNTEVYSSSFIATGVYTIGKIQLRPKPAIYYNYFRNAGYNMTAAVGGYLFSLPIAAYKFSFGFSQFAVEASRSITFKNGKVMIPYIELGVNYAFVQPNGGKILTGDLTMRQTSPWSGLARVGVRTLITRSLFIEAAASYLSLGQPHLNVWQARLFLSLALG